MNNASPELCLELYKLSGWEGARGSGLSIDYSINGPGSVGPVYDADYLAGKLPAGVTADRHMDGWEATVKGCTAFAEEWADVLATLCITLFKQGILTKEDK